METIRQLILKNELSNRTVNCLTRNGFDNITDLINHYNDHGDFLRLKFCGSKSSEELVVLCKKYIENTKGQEYLTELKQNDFSLIQIKIEELDALRQIILVNFIQNRRISLSKRGRDLFDSIYKNQIDIDSIYDNLLAIYNLDLKSLERNYGKRTIDELKSLNVTLIEFIERLSISEDSKNFKLNIQKDFFKAKLGLKEDEFNIINETYCIEDGRVPLFALCDYLINKKVIFNENERWIFFRSFKYYNNQIESWRLEDVGKELNLTRERVRQIRMKLLNNFQDYFGFINASWYLLDFEKDYSVKLDADYILISDQLCDYINSVDGTKFSKYFISRIIEQLLLETHVKLGFELNYHSFQKSKKFHPLIEPYIISKELNDTFRFKDFIDDVHKRLNLGITRSYKIPLDTYIYKFLSDPCLDYIIRLRKFCIYVLNNEFGLIINLSNEIIFQKNKDRSVPEVIYDALEELGYRKEGYHISEIANKIKSFGYKTDYTESLDSLRGTINRERSLFSYIGRNSTYFLKKWEDEHVEMKGGTIREIITEFLETRDSPQHLSSITNYVNNFRDTNETSILGNLKLDESNKYTFYDGSFVGLKDKNYQFDYNKYNQVNGGYFTKASCDKFLPDYYENFINNLVQSSGLMEIQVKSIIDKKIASNELVVNNNNVIRINNE